MDKPHPRFLASILWKKVRLIHGRLRYHQNSNKDLLYDLLGKELEDKYDVRQEEKVGRAAEKI